MDGAKFILNLKNLDLPELDDIDSSAYDWIFLSQHSNELISFWQYFFSKNNLSNKLSEEELSYYEELLGNGEVHSEKYILQMNECLQPSISIIDSSTNNFSKKEESSQIEILTKQLKVLTNKRNQLSLHKLEAESKVKKKEALVEGLSAEFEKLKSKLSTNCLDHSTSVKTLATTLDKVSRSLKPFLGDDENKIEENENFVIQLSIQDWQKKEELYSNAARTYVDRQLKESIEALANEEKDSSSYCLVDAGQMDLQLVRGPGSLEYIRNGKELNRIGKMLEYCEMESELQKIEMVKLLGQISEATKLMDDVKSDNFVNSIQYQSMSCQETYSAVQQDFSYLLKDLKNQTIKVAKSERLKTISGNYKVKLQRQEYFLSKQQIVVDLLMKQMSRYDAIKIVLDIEKQDIKDILEVLVTLNKFLTNDHRKATKRIDWLNALHHSAMEKNTDDVLDDYLQPFAQLLSSNDHCKEPFKRKNFGSAITELFSAIELTDSRLSKINELLMKNFQKALHACSSLEDCLFETSSTIKSWVPEDLLERQCQMELKAWELKQDMFQVLKDFEGKKKIVEKNPIVATDLIRWTKRCK